MRVRRVLWMFGLLVAMVLAGGCRGRPFRDQDVLYCYPMQCQPAPSTTQACPPGTVYTPTTPMVCCPQ